MLLSCWIYTSKLLVTHQTFYKGRTQCRELSLCAGSGEGCQWQALPSPVQCEETVTWTRDLPVTDGKTLPLAPGSLFTHQTFYIYTNVQLHTIWKFKLLLILMTTGVISIRNIQSYVRLSCVLSWEHCFHAFGSACFSAYLLNVTSMSTFFGYWFWMMAAADSCFLWALVGLFISLYAIWWCHVDLSQMKKKD